jgi:anaerobic ribonucleoside-triphosphate reductase activating protein
VGCTKHCKGCANPELWEISGRKDRSVKGILQMIQNLHAQQPIEGITVTGGDPLEQPEELLQLLEGLQEITEDILVYTGYTMQEIENLFSPSDLERLKKNIAVLIDGRYIEELNEETAVLRGSLNQNIIYFKEKYRIEYEEYLRKGRTIQNVYMGNQLISVGIHRRKGV